MLSLASQHARSFQCNLCGSVDDSRLTTDPVFSSLLEGRRELKTTNIMLALTSLCSHCRIYCCFHMNEKNGFSVHLFCYTIVSAYRTLRIFHLLIFSVSSCEGMHLSSLPSLVRFHFCLSSWSSIFLFLPLSHHWSSHSSSSCSAFIFFSPTLLSLDLLRKVHLAMSANVHPTTVFDQSISYQFSFSCIVLGVNALIMNRLGV